MGGAPVEMSLRALMQKLCLDRIGDLVADQVREVQVEVLRDEREVLARLIAKLDQRIASVGGKRRGPTAERGPTRADFDVLLRTLQRLRGAAEQAFHIALPLRASGALS